MDDKQSKKIGLYDSCFNSYVYNSIEPNTICLDIGCWTGNLGKSLINNKSCTLYGVDYNQKALAVARDNGYKRTFCLDLDNFTTLPSNQKFDYIIFADVLEHIKEPMLILKKIKRYLKPHGQIIISIPNFVFIQTRLSVLLGIFDYSDNGGILDINHLRFFTKKSFKKICLSSGYKIEKFYGYCQVKNRFIFLKFLSKIFDTLFSIQFLVILKK